MGAISLTEIGTITLNRFTLQLAGHYAALFRTAHAAPNHNALKLHANMPCALQSVIYVPENKPSSGNRE